MQKGVRVLFLIFIDILIINTSFVLSYLLRFDGAFGNIPPEFRIDFLRLMLIATAVKILCYLIFRLYNSLWVYASVEELMSIFSAAFISNMVMLSYVFLMRIPVPRSIFVITVLLDAFLIGALRFGYRIFRKLARHEVFRTKDSKRVLVIGGGDAGAIIVKELKTRHELNGIPVAIVDDDPGKTGRKIYGVPILGKREHIAEIVRYKKIDEIIIAIPSADKKTIQAIFTECEKTKCKVRILPSISQLIDGTVTIQRVRDVDIEDLLGRDPVRLDVEEISSYLEGQVVMVTGGGGSIGSELCRQIACFKPKQLIILDNYENNAFEIQNEIRYFNPELDLVTLIANIREKHRIDSIFSRYKPDVVFHAAAHKHVPLMESNPTEAIKNNVFGTMNVAECADKYGAKRFVLISTDKAVNPTNIMGATKRIAEMLIQGINRHSKTDFVAVRFGNVLGSNGSVIPLFKKQIEQGGPVTVTHPEVIRYFMTIPEAVNLVVQAGAMAKGGEIFVLDMGEPVRIYDLAKNLIRLSGFEPEVDIEIEFTGLRPGEKLYEELLTAEEGLESTQNDKIFVAQPTHTDLALLKREIDCLKEIIMMDAGGAIEYVQNIVPTYQKAAHMR